MFKPVRIVATVVLIAAIAMVFVGAFVLRVPVRRFPDEVLYLDLL